MKSRGKCPVFSNTYGNRTMPAAAPQPSELLVPRLQCRGLEPPPNPRLAQQSADSWGAPPVLRLRPSSCALVGVAQSRSLGAASRHRGAWRVAVPLVRSFAGPACLAALAPAVAISNTATSRHRRAHVRGGTARSGSARAAPTGEATFTFTRCLPRVCSRLHSRPPSNGQACARFAFGEDRAARRCPECAPLARSFGSFKRCRDDRTPPDRQGSPHCGSVRAPAWRRGAAVLHGPSAVLMSLSLTVWRLSSGGLSVVILCRPHDACSKAAHQIHTCNTYDNDIVHTDRATPDSVRTAQPTRRLAGRTQARSHHPETRPHQPVPRGDQRHARRPAERPRGTGMRRRRHSADRTV